MLSLVLMSCNAQRGLATNSDSNTNEIGTNIEKSSDTLVPNDDKDLDNQDILDTLVPNDEEFPFDTIIVERNGYDIVAAGKYYGDDFDSVIDYGSYYRIIDNYEDFSKLTQWGNQLDKAIFDENFVLVLYSYTKCSVYYSHPKFYELNGIGQFCDFKFDVNNSKISISETYSINGMNIDKDGYVRTDRKLSLMNIPHIS